ncbi:MAG: hypothetical protein COV67_04505 [Nitrospinae bacterium CG11_big_fil_rev_8_21_14_0_20_56_8]|nr:MAG: hypothetical protein COV67_04505 [Nitrospinae bacterium CG11_big_fil_rev_8_21_14_0_20_56_8]
MNIALYDPRNEIQHFFDHASRLFAEPGPNFFPAWQEPENEVKVNIIESKTEFVLEALVPGWKESEIDLEVQENRMVLRGRMEETPEPQIDYRTHEFSRRPFERRFRLGAQVEIDKISAKLENGILRITLSKREEAKPRRVEIQAEN